MVNSYLKLSYLIYRLLTLFFFFFFFFFLNTNGTILRFLKASERPLVDVDEISSKVSRLRPDSFTFYLCVPRCRCCDVIILERSVSSWYAPSVGKVGRSSGVLVLAPSVGKAGRSSGVLVVRPLRGQNRRSSGFVRDFVLPATPRRTVAWCRVVGSLRCLCVRLVLCGLRNYTLWGHVIREDEVFFDSTIEIRNPCIKTEGQDRV